MSRCVSFRNIKTTQERRQNEAVLSDPELVELSGRVLLVRPKRINLPSAYDDIPHSTKFNDNSWKRHRMTQYYRGV